MLNILSSIFYGDEGIPFTSFYESLISRKGYLKLGLHWGAFQHSTFVLKKERERETKSAGIPAHKEHWVISIIRRQAAVGLQRSY